MRRGQSAMEFFLVVSTLVLVFTWLANYADVFYTSSSRESVLYAHQAFAARVATLAGESCAERVSFTVPLDCPRYSNSPDPFTIRTEEGSLINPSVPV